MWHTPAYKEKEEKQEEGYNEEVAKELFDELLEFAKDYAEELNDAKRDNSDLLTLITTSKPEISVLFPEGLVNAMCMAFAVGYKAAIDNGAA
jgi:hypothetical protein